MKGGGGAASATRTPDPTYGVADPTEALLDLAAEGLVSWQWWLQGVLLVFTCVTTRLVFLCNNAGKCQT